MVADLSLEISNLPLLPLAASGQSASLLYQLQSISQPSAAQIRLCSPLHYVGLLAPRLLMPWFCSCRNTADLLQCWLQQTKLLQTTDQLKAVD